MPKVESWNNLLPGVRQHPAERMRDRLVSTKDLNQLRVWVESNPEVPLGDWYKDFGSFEICGEGFTEDISPERAGGKRQGGLRFRENFI